MSLAEIEHKERQLGAMISQFRTQARRLPRQFIYGQTTLDASISAMGEIEERLADALANQRRLTTIKKALTDELVALESVKQVSEARHTLGDLKRRRSTSGEDSGTETEIRRLEQFIAEHSKRAEQVITERYEERTQEP